MEREGRTGWNVSQEGSVALCVLIEAPLMLPSVLRLVPPGE